MRYTREELAEARRSIDSTLRKCEKALEKLRPGTSPHTLTVRRIRAFRIALALIDREMDGTEIPVHRCVREKGLDHCGECGDFPCPKLGKMGDFRDLDTGRVKERTCRAVAAEGLPAWLAEYEEKADLLTVALERYNNGRMKRYLCELFLQQDLDTLRRIMARAEALEGADSKELGRAFQALVGEMLES